MVVPEWLLVSERPLVFGELYAMHLWGSMKPAEADSQWLNSGVKAEEGTVQG